MTRLPLKISGSRVTVRATLISPGIPRSRPIEMIVDTGSSSVVLSQKDAEVLGIAVAGLPRSESARLGFGGRMDAGVLNNVLLGLKDSEDRSYTVPLQTIVVNRATSLKKQNERQVYSIPSILGTDVLVAGDLALFAHINKGVAHFDHT